MTYNFNNVDNAYYRGNIELNRIYGTGGMLLWEKKHSSEYAGEYLTFQILSSGSITWKNRTSSTASKKIRYSKNNGEWTELESTDMTGVSISVNAGDLIRFRGTNNSYNGVQFNTSVSFNLYGNISSLIYGSDFVTTVNPILNQYGLPYLFEGCSNLRSAGDLVIPFVNVKAYSLEGMFKDCSSLITAPKLPATIGTEKGVNNWNWDGNYAYRQMFKNCTSLTMAPALPSMVISIYAYEEMFAGCTALSTAPLIAAMILPTGACTNMFASCSNLNYIQCLATGFGSECLNNWTGRLIDGYIVDRETSGVSSTGIFVKSNGIVWPAGTSGIPNGWTIQSV